MNAYLTLFASALLAATLVPFSSEALLGVLYAGGAHEPWALLTAASAGNVLGSCVNWGLGRYCLAWRHKRWFPFRPDGLTRASDWFNRFGVWSLLLAWLPVIGDPLTFVAGLLRTPLVLFLPLVAIGKVARYLLVLGLLDPLLG